MWDGCHSQVADATLQCSFRYHHRRKRDRLRAEYFSEAPSLLHETDARCLACLSPLPISFALGESQARCSPRAVEAASSGPARTAGPFGGWESKKRIEGEGMALTAYLRLWLVLNGK